MSEIHRGLGFQPLSRQSHYAPKGYNRRLVEYVLEMLEHRDKNPNDGSWGRAALQRLHEEFGHPQGGCDCPPVQRPEPQPELEMNR